MVENLENEVANSLGGVCSKKTVIFALFGMDDSCDRSETSKNRLRVPDLVRVRYKFVSLAQFFFTRLFSLTEGNGYFCFSIKLNSWKNGSRETFI